MHLKGMKKMEYKVICNCACLLREVPNLTTMALDKCCLNITKTYEEVIIADK